MKNYNSALPVPELSRPLKVERVPVGGIEEHIVATPSEREALIKRFDLVDLSRFEAFLNVDREKGGMFSVTGHILADAVQRCVVTLEPVSERVKETIDLLFAPPQLLKKDKDGPLSEFGDVEPPEPIENGMIDLGELVSQLLATSLSPYPRKEGASLGVIEVKAPIETAEIKPLNPFAKLKLVLPEK